MVESVVVPGLLFGGLGALNSDGLGFVIDFGGKPLFLDDLEFSQLSLCGIGIFELAVVGFVDVVVPRIKHGGLLRVLRGDGRFGVFLGGKIRSPGLGLVGLTLRIQSDFGELVALSYGLTIGNVDLTNDTRGFGEDGDEVGLFDGTGESEGGDKVTAFDGGGLGGSLVGGWLMSLAPDESSDERDGKDARDNFLFPTPGERIDNFHGVLDYIANIGVGNEGNVNW